MRRYKNFGIGLGLATLVLSMLFSFFPPLPGSGTVSADDANKGCRADQYWLTIKNPISGATSGQCVNKVDQPRRASDCPAGYTFQPAQPAKGPGGNQPATCNRNGGPPKSINDCPNTTDYYFINGVGNVGSCVKKVDAPRNAGDCPAFYVFVQSIGLGTPSTCKKVTQADATALAKASCADVTGPKTQAACERGYAAGYLNGNKDLSCDQATDTEKNACKAAFDTGRRDASKGVVKAADVT